MCFEGDIDEEKLSDYDSSDLDFMDLGENMIPVNHDIAIAVSQRNLIATYKRILVIDDEPFNVVGL